MKRNPTLPRAFVALAFAIACAPFGAGCSGTSHTNEANDAGTGGEPSAGGHASAAGGAQAGAAGSSAGGHAGKGSGGAGTGGGAVGTAGAPSHGGAVGIAGAPSQAGAPSGAGSPNGGAGGGSNCIDGAFCQCDPLTQPATNGTVGTIQCPVPAPPGLPQIGPTCVCPPADQCQVKEDPTCFVPCGGDPFGAWVLEASCFATTKTSRSSTCDTVTQATPGKNDLRMRILDGGSLEVYGTEDWSATSRISLGCNSLKSTASCTGAFFSADPLLFSYLPASRCAASACGACDCASDAQKPVPDFYQYNQWHRDGTLLGLGNLNVGYCVQGDELWIGGPAGGLPKVSYKFKKQSCVGAPLPCASRTSTQCQAGLDCVLGACKPKGTVSAAHCAVAATANDCGVLQGCSWDPNTCTGDASASCDFASCPAQPGCAWGPPTEKCGGDSSCSNRDVTDCADLGCHVAICDQLNSPEVDCSSLLTTADCAKAPGCVSHSGGATPCTGTAQCTAQTDAATCLKLGCQSGSFCDGDQTACSLLSLTDCDRIPGCQRQW